MAEAVPDGTLIRFRNWVEALGIEIAGQLGTVDSHYYHGRSVRYRINVGPGSGVTSHFKRTDFAIVKR